MIDEVARILTANGLAFRLRDVGVPNTKGSIVKSKKPMWDLHIDGIKRVKRALDVLLPHIRSKQDQAILLWHFATHRLEQGHFGGYSVFDDWCSKRLREIKNSSETMSVAEIYSDDIVRPALKGVEVAEMSTRQFEKLVRK